MVERQTRMLQVHVPFGREGSNPFFRIFGKVAQLGTAPDSKSGKWTYSRAGSNPVLSLMTSYLFVYTKRAELISRYLYSCSF